MIVDGNKIADEILAVLKKEVLQLETKITLVVLVVGEHLATERFIALKKKRAEDIGIQVRIVRFPLDMQTATLQNSIQQNAKDKTVRGIIVQLPLPKDVDAEAVLASIPEELDIDVLAPRSTEKFSQGTLDILPPVVGAINEIVEREGVPIEGKHVVVVGRGALVGMPAARWFEQRGARVSIVSKKTKDLPSLTKEADIIVSGAGVPMLITPDMIRDGAILFDAGTSEAGGKLSGDADPHCALKCQIFTPVPGGIGPITVAVLLQNLVKRALLLK